jgi:hypothetical protein
MIDKKARGKAIGEKNIKLRQKFWPEATEEDLWNKSSKGFIAIPRVLPLIHLIMDELSIGSPVSDTYFALWCRNWDQNVIEVESAKTIAVESGFLGQRCETTWVSRIKKLKDLGFIKTAPGTSHEHQYILMLNPFRVVTNLYEKKKVDKKIYNSLIERALKIGSVEF